MLNQVNNKKIGSVTIEATISLTAFMFAIVTILSIVNICIAQARIGYAINVTAREISQYSYLYSLTGVNQSQGRAYKAGLSDTTQLRTLVEDINETYDEIENISAGVSGIKNEEIDFDAVSGAFNNVLGSGEDVLGDIKNIASDPKTLIFGMAKIGASNVFDIAKSKLIAAPLAKYMCKKNLVPENDGDVEAFLKSLGVVKTGKTYLDSLDFSDSTLFPNGTDEITIKVSYDIKVINLLPFDFSFHFCQSAKTMGWSAGDVSFKTNNPETKFTENHTIWSEDVTISERSDYIRHIVMSEMIGNEGYKKTSGLTDVQLYNPETNNFTMIASMNPLFSTSDEPPKTLDDIDEDAVRKAIERLCGKMSSTTDGLSNVKTKTELNGTTTKAENNCNGATNTIVLIVPQDSGLKDKIEEIVKEANTRGVKVEVYDRFGNGASATEVSDEE